MAVHLKKIIKALLFSTSEALSEGIILDVFKKYNDCLDSMTEGEQEGQEKIKINSKIIRGLIQEIKEDLEKEGEVYRVLEEADGFALVVDPQYADWVRLLRDEERGVKLSNAGLETLAIVAYRQPVTRVEIEAIRGVSAESSLTRLMDLGLIEISGLADLPGKPRLYGTTKAFLKFCGLPSLEALPTQGILPEQVISHFVKEVQGKKPGDAEVGLAEEFL